MQRIGVAQIVTGLIVLIVILAVVQTYAGIILVIAIGIMTWRLTHAARNGVPVPRRPSRRDANNGQKPWTSAAGRNSR